MFTPLTDDQDQLRRWFRDFARQEVTSARVRAAEPLGFDEALWERTASIGAVGVGIAEELGGGGTGFVEAALLVEQLGACLAPIPMVEAIVAGRLLAGIGTSEADDLLQPMLEGRGITTIALRAARDGWLRFVPAGAVADGVLALADGDLVVVRRGNERPRWQPNLGNAPIGDWSLGDRATSLGLGGESPAVVERALDEWRVLNAASLVGLAAEALDLGVKYVKERTQFGRPIASFQSIAHGLAEAATAVDGARLLVYEAAGALDSDAVRSAALASMAWLFAAETAARTTYVSLHYHGGYGFMEEYDIQLYYRRARGWPLALGRADNELMRVAEHLRIEESSAVTTGSDSGDMRGAMQGLRERFLTDEVVESIHESGTVFDRSFHRALAQEGWLTAGWPIEDGGQGRSSLELAPFYEEAALAGVPLDITLTTMLVAETLRRIGTADQRSTILTEITSGNVIVCLGFSEPDAGSDVAAVRTRARRDNGDWVIDGQKMFTTGAQIADFVFLLTRTNSEVPKHRGLTLFLVPMSSPGIEVQELRTLSGVRTNITYYSSVRVSDSARVGDVDGGWPVLMITLAFERGMVPTAAGRCQQLLDLALRWGSTARDESGEVLLLDPHVRRRLAGIAVKTEVARLLGLRSVELHSRGSVPGVEGSMAKLFATEALQDVVGNVLEAFGSAAMLQRQSELAPMRGEFEHAYRHAAVETIYGGTSEIQREIIASQGLGLPRSN